MPIGPSDGYAAGRGSTDLTASAYLTISLHDDPTVADRNLDDFLAAYYPAPPAAMRAVQAVYAGPPAGLGGPNRWPPLLYCCYSRLVTDDDHSTVATAKVLLDAGADPNAGFLWRGLVPPFTALTGTFGRGEADQPPHPAATDLARALLEAGADPNDGQTLYNNGLAGTAHDDPTHVELLVEFGLGTNANGPWYQRFGGRLTEPAELLYDELEVAAHRGLPKRMRHLATLGLDLDRPVGRSKRTPWNLATDGGHRDVLAVLAEAGTTGPDGPR